MDWIQVVVTALFSALAAFGGASIGLYRFRYERWFDKRYQAAADLLEHMNVISSITGTLKYLNTEEAKSDHDAWKEAVSKKEQIFSDANEKLMRIMGIRRFLFPQNLIDILDEFQNRWTDLERQYFDIDRVRMCDERDKLMSEVHNRFSIEAKAVLGSELRCLDRIRSSLRKVLPFCR